MNGNDQESNIPIDKQDKTLQENSEDLSLLPEENVTEHADTPIDPTEPNATENEIGADEPLEEELEGITEHEDASIETETQKSTEQEGPSSEEPESIEDLPVTVPNPPINEDVNATSDKTGEEPVVDFNFLETESRWLLKVISGPNSGAEFALHGGSSYIIGTDPAQCDIIFHDMSISRKHAKITIDSKENATIEDVDSKNGIFIDGQKITSYTIKSSIMITLGTTTFVLNDRTQEQKTIIALKAPLQEPSNELSQKNVQVATALTTPVQETPEKQMETIREASIPSLHTEVEKIKEESKNKGWFKKISHTLFIFGIVSLVLLGIGVGATFLFRTEKVEEPAISNPQEIIAQTLKNFPAVRFSYNPSTKHLLLVGHVLTAEDQTRMLDMIQQLPFVDELNSSGVVIDEFVWREINQIIAKNSDWRGITITAPNPGQFVLSGFLKTRAQNEKLLEYLTQNFSYMNLLEQKVVIEEDLLNQITQDLAKAGCQGVKASISNGELILTGAVPSTKNEEFEQLLTKFRALAGIRAVQSQVTQSGEAQSIVDISGKYHITGYSRQKGNVSVVVDGRIVGRGDILDGMLIVDITSTTIFLEHNGVTYKINYIK